MRASVGLLLAAVTACASRSNTEPRAPASKPAALACSRQLAPRSAPRSAAPPSPPVVAPPSRLIVEARLPLSKLATELERNVAPRVAEGNAIRIGPAGVLNYSVDRGAFSVSIVDGRLVVEAPLSGRAEACSGRRCYASCEPRATARAEIPLWLRPDYRFEGSRVALEFTRGCRVRALGGLLSVDVTPMLRSTVAPQLERVRREIDGQLPDVRADVARAWRQLSAPRALPPPLGGCVMIEPLGLVQGPMRESEGMAHARFALLARPELRSDCGGTPAPSAPLPPLSADRAMPDEDSVTFGMELPLSSLASAFEAAALPTGSEPRFHVEAATIEARGQRVVTELTLAGDVCGAVALEAEPTFAGEDGFIGLTRGQLAAGEEGRVRAAGLEPAALAERLTRLPRAATPLSLPMLRIAPTALAALLSDPEFSLSTRVSSLHAEGAAARGANLVAWVRARGSLLLEQR